MDRRLPRSSAIAGEVSEPLRIMLDPDKIETSSASTIMRRFNVSRDVIGSRIVLAGVVGEDDATTRRGVRAHFTTTGGSQ